MDKENPAKSFSLRALKAAIKEGYTLDSIALAFRQHIQSGEKVYVFDDRQGEADQPRWTVCNEDDIQAIVEALS